MKKRNSVKINFNERMRKEIATFKIVSEHKIKTEKGFEDTFYDVVAFTRKFPEVTTAILNAIRVEEPKRKVYCHFPGECNYFPCPGLRCDYTALSNGTPTTPY